ncbi:energy transducer TonB [Pseudoalteromonas rubra]|uniref:Energy transducer TonB n=1 Tax=Pseudoalteromonas rubra TaxID=43658 RepID=A0A0U2XBL4_9GAMM|nr:energy transducer TonB [Pseudoalteromonas rubra]ALU45236.1 energy transducer TonB [Pseudoalteromonas rubra]
MKYLLIALFTLVFIGGCSSTSQSDPQVKNGYVQMQFDINEQGRPENIRIIESSHNGLFDQEAIRSLKEWKYNPKTENGTPVRQTNQKVQLEFDIKN